MFPSEWRGSICERFARYCLTDKQSVRRWTDTGSVLAEAPGYSGSFRQIDKGHIVGDAKETQLRTLAQNW